MKQQKFVLGVLLEFKGLAKLSIAGLETKLAEPVTGCAINELLEKVRIFTEMGKRIDAAVRFVEGEE